jgi:carboxyl-terminal processing protease
MSSPQVAPLMTPGPRTRTARSLMAAIVLVTVFLAGVLVGQGTRSEPVVAGGRPTATVPPDAPANVGIVWEALRVLRRHYVDESALTDQNLTQGAIRGMVEALGDTGHSVYLTPDEVKAEQETLEGRLVGIGVTIDQRTGAASVISVLDGSPADRAGVRVGDVILAVNGVPTEHSQADDIVRLVRGEVGTPVRLLLRRAGVPDVEVSMVRERIQLAPVSWAFVPGSRIADIRLVQFSAAAGRDVRRAVREALAADARAIVLDLRGNPGGLVDEAVRVASTFLGSGVVYQERDRDGEVTPVRVRQRALAPEAPLAVLVDHGSASSSEIVAGALRDNERATIVGERTFGTGTVLTLFPLSDGSAIRLGVLNWLTPDGDGIFDTGIAPDEVVALPSGATILDPADLEDLSAGEFATSDDSQLKHAVRLLRAEET